MDLQIYIYQNKRVNVLLVCEVMIKTMKVLILIWISISAVTNFVTIKQTDYGDRLSRGAELDKQDEPARKVVVL